MLPGEFGWAVLLQPGQAAVSSKGQTDSCLLSWYLNAPEEEVQTVWRWRFAFGGGMLYDSTTELADMIGRAEL